MNHFHNCPLCRRFGGLRVRSCRRQRAGVTSVMPATEAKDNCKLMLPAA